MKPPQSLQPRDSDRPATMTTLRGQVGASGELLASPASGAPCVHWRLRIFERISPTMELVHEALSPEPFELRWTADPTVPPQPVRLDAERAAHRGPAGAAPGGLGRRPGGGPPLRAAGPGAGRGGADPAGRDRRGQRGAVRSQRGRGAGPFRANQATAELCDATVKLPTGISIRPALLPWALGTAAALLGAAGAVSALSKLWKLRLEGAAAADTIGPVKIRRPRWP